MRKTSEEITREVFGQGSRWIGWDNWLKHQPVFKYIERKVAEGIDVFSARGFFIKDMGRVDFSCMPLCVDVNPKTGHLENVDIYSYEGSSSVSLRKKSSTYHPPGSSDPGIGLEELFEDPWRPTFEELDLFQLLYGDEQILIDMNRDFYGVVRQLNKAVAKNSLKIIFMDK